MRVLFLDIDGVLTLELQQNPYIFSKIEEARPRIELLNQVLTKGQAELVISSSWRKDNEIESLACRLGCNGLLHPILDFTPQLAGVVPGGGRGHEIAAWLYQKWARHGTHVESICILDDGCDMMLLQPFLIRTESAVGLTQQLANAAIHVLQQEARLTWRYLTTSRG